ncbi:hypothetical protein Y032_0019g3861 [Ancylostoma ceylanicum]|uniref:Uncharacterized protein n=1 Tax=Ancylostoma ceylanicum TaxID=53326 RepID=A0A016V2P5_9BILA|nr:hypothetical protein Y032_0019g3861 [Ancylostoma ceylanicum]
MQQLAETTPVEFLCVRLQFHRQAVESYLVVAQRRYHRVPTDLLRFLSNSCHNGTEYKQLQMKPSKALTQLTGVEQINDEAT